MKQNAVTKFFKSLYGNYAISGRYAKKYRIFYICLLSIICVFEIVMICRSAFSGFAFPKHDVWLYLACYLVLLVASATTIVILILDKKKDFSAKRLSTVSNFYTSIIIIWATVITILDSKAGHYPAVYLTIIATVGGVIVVNPLIYVSTTFITDVTMMILIHTIGQGDAYSSGDNINIIVFVVMAFAVSIRNYIVSVNEDKARFVLEKVSKTDQLTGLNNATAYYETVDLTNSQNALNHGYVVFLMDVNGLKQTNDNIGHQYGSQLLIEAAKTLTDIFGNDQVFRIGGDEFAVIIHDDFEAVSEKITIVEQELSNREVEMDGKRFILSVAAGFASWRKGDEYRAVFQRADEMMYANKANMKKDLPLGKDLNQK